MESIHIQTELAEMSRDEREYLLKSVSKTKITSEQGLALTVDIAIPWNKLRVMRRCGFILNE